MGRWAALSAAALLVGACVSPTIVLTPTPSATPAPSPVATQAPRATALIDHPTGATDIVLRVEDVPSMAPYPGDTFQEGPPFTLYGDGHLIYSGPPSAEAPTALQHAQLATDEVDTVLTEALDVLGAARGVYDDVPISDAGWTHFTINAGGNAKVTQVYAIDSMEYTGSDPVGFHALGALKASLIDYARTCGRGEAECLGEYEPLAYRASLVRPWWTDGESEPATNAEWPWSDLDASDFTADESELVRTITPAQAAAVIDQGIADSMTTRAPDDQVYVIRVRPLLPDQQS
jgi:hypothetical protein